MRKYPNTMYKNQPGFVSNFANGLVKSFKMMNFKVEISQSDFDFNNCETLYLDLSVANFAEMNSETKTLETSIKLPIFNCSVVNTRSI